MVYGSRVFGCRKQIKVCMFCAQNAERLLGMFRTYRRARVNTAIDVDFCNRIDFFDDKNAKKCYE